MILEIVKHGLLIWPTIEENRVTRTNKYAELSAIEKIQVDCDLKENKIILQGLSSDIYSLVNYHRVAKDLWERIQLQMQVHQYAYPRPQFVPQIEYTVSIINQQTHLAKFPQIDSSIAVLVFKQGDDPIDDINNIMSFMSTIVSSRFPTTNIQLRNSSNPRQQAATPEGRVTVQPVRGKQGSFAVVHQYAYPRPQFVPQIEYTVSIINQQTHLAKFPQIDSSIAVLVFKQGDDPIDDINNIMSFMSTIVSSRFPTTNIQLRNSSNPRQQAATPEGRVTVQPVRGKQGSFAVGTYGTRANISETSRNNLGQQRIVKYFNFQAKAVLMANLSSYISDVLSEVPHSKNTHTDMLNQSVQEILYSEQTHLVNYPKNEITSDSNIIPYSQCQLETQNAVVLDINSFAQQDVMILSLFEQLSNQVTNCNKVNKDNLKANESLFAELERYKERVKLLEERKNIDLKQSKEKKLLTKIFNGFENESKEKEAKNIDIETALEKKVKELDNNVCKMGQSLQTMHTLMKPQVLYDNNLKQSLVFQNPFYLNKSQQIRLMLYDGNLIAKEINSISIADFEEILMIEDVSGSKMLLKQSDPMVLKHKVKIKPIIYAELN
nr:hypothetical protein [Tanacetum cinerariifolium]